MVTRQTLGRALELMGAYQNAFAIKYPGEAVVFNVLAVSTIDDLTHEQLAAGDLEIVEFLSVGSLLAPG